MKNIVKNVNKFNKIKLATGLDLQKFKVVDVLDNFYGLSILAGKKFILPNGQGFFKYYPSEEFIIDNKSIRIINELLSYYLSSDLGIECAKYEPAIYNKLHGLVSYNVVNENIGEKLVSGHRLIHETLNTYESHSYKLYERLFNVCKDYKIKIDIEKTLLDIYKIMVYDILIMQTDRHSGNLNFIYNSKENSLRLSPLFDNEFIFGGLCYENDNLIDFYKNFYENTIGIAYNKNYFSKMSYDDYLKQVASMAVNNSEYKQVLFHFINDINLKKAYKEVEKLGYEVNADYKNFTKAILASTRQKLSLAYKQVLNEKNKLEKVIDKKCEEIENTK